MTRPFPSPIQRKPFQHLLIFTCMDPRIDPVHIFNLIPAEATILRNAGAIITDDTMRSILIACYEQDVNYIVILGHRDCGQQRIKSIELNMKIDEKLGRATRREIVFLEFKDSEENVKQEVARLRGEEALKHVTIEGAIYDEVTGKATFLKIS